MSYMYVEYTQYPEHATAMQQGLSYSTGVLARQTVKSRVRVQFCTISQITVIL